MKRILLGLLLALLVACSVFPINAHVKDRPDLAPWFNQLKNGKKQPCCSNSDGTTLTDADWQVRKDRYWVYVPTRPPVEGTPPTMDWVMVPDDAIITEPNKYGQTVVWPLYGPLGIEIRCFMPGSLT